MYFVNFFAKTGLSSLLAAFLLSQFHNLVTASPLRDTYDEVVVCIPSDSSSITVQYGIEKMQMTVADIFESARVDISAPKLHAEVYVSILCTVRFTARRSKVGYGFKKCGEKVVLPFPSSGFHLKSGYRIGNHNKELLFNF